MNEAGEYIKKTQCPYCKYNGIIARRGYPGCMNNEKRKKCANFAKGERDV